MRTQRPIRTPKELGAAIRERRRQLGLDQRSLAERVGVSRQWVIEAERGKAGAPLGLILQTLEALGLTLMLSEVPPEVATTPASPVDIDDIVRRARRPR